MKILVTAGPTREAIDPVRFLSNRSTGKMGYAIAAKAIEKGHEVVLISGPVNLTPPATCHLVGAETAEQMYRAVEGCLDGTIDIAIFTAAVADYRPVSVSSEKLKKVEGELSITLERTRDILGSMRSVFGYEGVLVGFAAETTNLRDYAIGKMKRKGCDMMVANDVSRSDIGFGNDSNEVYLFFSDGGEEHLGVQPKTQIAERLLEAAIELVG